MQPVEITTTSIESSGGQVVEWQNSQVANDSTTQPIAERSGATFRYYMRQVFDLFDLFLDKAVVQAIGRRTL